MHVLIDCQRMMFCYRHKSSVALANLAHIELSHSPVKILQEDNFASEFSDLELKLLYENTTGTKYQGFSRPALLEAVAPLPKYLPECTFNIFEIFLQAGQVPMTDKTGVYRFVPGSRQVAAVQTLFEPAALTCNAAPTGRDHPPASTNTPTISATAPCAAEPALPKGGNKATIWMVADEMYEADGKPTEKSAVLALRKRMMDRLEAEYGIKRISSSNELGTWMKNRVAI